jgi:hypothetical protein
MEKVWFEEHHELTKEDLKKLVSAMRKQGFKKSPKNYFCEPNSLAEKVMNAIIYQKN